MTTNSNGGPANFAKLFSSLAAVFKAVPADKLADLNDALDHNGVAPMTDMWNQARGEHSAPSRAEVVTGPAEHMSGSGAEKMIRQYSDLSNQSGLAALYATFERVLSDFSKSMTADFNKKFGAIAEVLSDVAKNQQAIDAILKAAQEDGKPTAPAEDTFFAKAQSKLEKARKAFRKAEMDEDEEEREERKSHLREVSDLLKSVLKLISKAEDEEKNDEDEVEKAVTTAKSLQARVNAALAAITKAEEEEKEEEEKAEKARVAAEAAAKGNGEGGAPAAAVKAEDEKEEEKKDDTAKAQALTLENIEKSLKGLATLPTTLEGFMNVFSGVSRTLVTPPNLAVIKGGVDQEAAFTAAVDSGQVTGQDVLVGQQLFARRRAASTGQYPQDKLNQDIASAPEAVRRFFG